MMGQITERFPGISCAYMDAAGSITAECYGVADRENHIPVDETTLFPACSISKFVTAIGVMKLHGNGVIDIDAPVNAYLKQWKLREPGGRESDAAIRSLMCHTAGVLDGEDGFYGLRRHDPPISLMDILEGRAAYNNRPARVENPPGEVFEYSDAGYCILQLLVEEITGQPFDAAMETLVFDALRLKSTFYASPARMARYEASGSMAVGYDGDGLPIPGKYPQVPDLAASALWSTPGELLAIGREFVAACNGSGMLLRQESALAMAKPAEHFPWIGLGVFLRGGDRLMSQGWGENGQCMMLMNRRTNEVSVVMTNRNPEVDQQASGVEWLAQRRLIRAE